VEALLDAAEEDVATGGPDPARGIFPTVLAVTAEGVRQVSQEDLRAAYEAVVAQRSRDRGSQTSQTGTGTGTGTGAEAS
jgi:proteasome beta subunit